MPLQKMTMTNMILHIKHIRAQKDLEILEVLKDQEIQVAHTMKVETASHAIVLHLQVQYLLAFTHPITHLAQQDIASNLVQVLFIVQQEVQVTQELLACQVEDLQHKL